MNIILGQNESLPNIKGDLGLRIDSTGERYINGCFYVNTNNNPMGTFANLSRNLNISFSANKSSTVYTDNARVKPMTFTYKNWIRKF